LKIGVSCILAVGIVGLVALLIQGCKRNDNNSDTNADNNPPPISDTNNTVVDTNMNPPMMTNGMPVEPTGSNEAQGTVVAPVPGPGAVAPEPPVNMAPVPPAAPSGGSEYIVQAGDTLGKIAKKNGVSLRALEAANPNVNPKHLKVKQKLVIPAGGSAAGGISATAPGSEAVANDNVGGERTYTVKSGDTLHKIAKKFGVSTKAIEEANGMSTTRINVGRKLKIPGKAEAPAPAPAAPVAPVQSTPMAPAPTAPAPVSNPANVPAAPSGT
jgi:LysM repeat protein